MAGHLPSFDHDLTLRVDLHVSAGSGWAAAGDDLAEKIGAAILTDADYLADINVSGFAWHNTKLRPSGEGEDVVAVLEIEFGLVFGWVHEAVIEDTFEQTDINVDAVDPADPNTGHAEEPGGYEGGSPGPDGRIEGRVSADPEQ